VKRFREDPYDGEDWTFALIMVLVGVMVVLCLAWLISSLT
jgi:hypothetical protein